MPPIMISACLLGIHCRYDGKASLNSGLVDFIVNRPFIPFCPEQLGGLPTPRPAARMVGGDGRDVITGKAKLINTEQMDVTGAFIKGAEEAARLARITGTLIAIMKTKSPSCGLRAPYYDKSAGMGMGVTAALFKSLDIAIIELDSNDPFPINEFKNIHGVNNVRSWPC